MSVPKSTHRQPLCPLSLAIASPVLVSSPKSSTESGGSVVAAAASISATTAAAAFSEQAGYLSVLPALIGIVIMLFAGIFVAIVVVRRGLRASTEAQRLLAEDGQPPPPRRLGSVLGAAMFVIAVFSAVAILVVSRGCL